MKAYFWNRVFEASSLRGLIAFVCGVAGWALSQAQADALLSFALAIGGLLKVLLPDKFNENRNTISAGEG